MTTTEELLKNSFLRLPKSYNDTGVGFKKYIEQILSEYLILAQSLPPMSGIDVKKLEVLIDGINTSLSEYYNGHPFNAYSKLTQAITDSGITTDGFEGSMPKDTNFYRLRLKKENYHLLRKELFHIPFELRHKVETKRYSIPGFPSLYLSNSIYVAWEEMRRPKLDEIQSARLKSTGDITYIDLTTSKYSGSIPYKDSDAKKADKMASDIMTWPLIASCAIKVKNVEEPFKPEYIIPQLLLQWIRNSKKIDAIKFSSSHIELAETLSKGEFYNLVIPVKENKESGYCSDLSKMFMMTEVLSWQLHQFTTGREGIREEYSAKPINPDISRISLIKNRSYP